VGKESHFFYCHFLYSIHEAKLIFPFFFFPSPFRNQYIVIDHDKHHQVTFERRRDSVISNGSNESIEKIPEETSGSSKVRCLLTMKSTDNLYGITFLSMEEEEKFLKQFTNCKATN